MQRREDACRVYLKQDSLAEPAADAGRAVEGAVVGLTQ